MYRNFKTRRLVAIFIVLLLIFAVVELKDMLHGDRSIRTLVISIDTAKVTGISISAGYPKAVSVGLQLENGQWKVAQKGKQYNAEPKMVQYLLGELSNLKPQWLAATSRDQWADYQVNDSMGMKVLIEEKNRRKKMLVIGKISYQQPTNPYDRQGQMSTFVRAGDDDQVYAVQGFLRMSVSPDMNSYRVKNLLEGNSSGWTNLTFSYPADSSFTLTREKTGWTLNGTLADSLTVEEYIHGMDGMTGNEFADTSLNNVQPLLKLSIEGNNLKTPLQLDAYASKLPSAFILHSSVNPEGWFRDNRAGLSARIFRGKSYFLKKPGHKK